MTNLERLQESRRMLQDIIMEVAGPFYESRSASLDVDIPEDMKLNIALYYLWEEILTLHRALRLSDNGL